MTNDGTVITDDPATWPEVGRQVLVRERRSDFDSVIWVVCEGRSRSASREVWLVHDNGFIVLPLAKHRSAMWWPLPEVTE